MISLNYPESKVTAREKKVIALPKFSRDHCLLLTSEVNLYEALTRIFISIDRENQINTLMFEQESVDGKYLQAKNYDYVFKPIMGLGRIKQLICTANLIFFPHLKKCSFDYSYIVSLEKIYLVPRFLNGCNRQRSIIDEDSFEYDIKATDNKTTIECSFDAPASEWPDHSSRGVAKILKRATSIESTEPELINCHYTITIYSSKKIDICFIKESQYEQLIKESLKFD
ncbi:MAG: hypothetical protein Harvfovirus55_2 [Harvfovirus sp.]|uniref:Uncharacterized protein n=1 Tax=Harvfovirus sp. TaxID=2487768 RepID=A0A3G5A788_9VIRU|nr:MAG: hypothetical protein Harvfovirus55_2 [Harvfovirus sp.]